MNKFDCVCCVVPDVVHTQTATANWCWQDPNEKAVEWYPSRGKGECFKLSGIDDDLIVKHQVSIHTNSVVVIVKMYVDGNLID